MNLIVMNKYYLTANGIYNTSIQQDPLDLIRATLQSLSNIFNTLCVKTLTI